MATYSPPSKAISPPEASSPQVSSSSGDSLSSALDFLDQLRDAGLSVAPVMPAPEALQNAALQAGISPKEALTAYLTILNYE